MMDMKDMDSLIGFSLAAITVGFLLVVPTALFQEAKHGVPVTPALAASQVASVVFTRHANGLCFAVTRTTGRYHRRNGVTLAVVPSEYCQ